MIEARNLQKRFGAKLAVDDVSFTVQKGEVLGFLGPNGAGKSTTMRMITGYLPATAGSVRVGGHDVADDGLAARSLLGYLPENAPVYSDMTVQGFLRFAAELRGVHGAVRDAAVDRVVETCFLQPVRRQTVDTLSKGYIHRTCLAQSLLHDPPALVLDEPTDGLDPNQKHEVRSLIKRMGETKAIILSTHILEEVDAICSRVIIIDRGRLVANGTPAELRARSASAGQVTLRLGGVADAAAAEAALTALDAVETVQLLDREGGCLFRLQPKRGVVAGDGLAAPLLKLAAAKGWMVGELHTEEGRLDEFFRGITVPDTVR